MGRRAADPASGPADPDSFAERAEELRREDAITTVAQARSLVALAFRHRAGGRLAAGVEALRLAAAIAPRFAPAWNDLGVLLVQLGDPAGSISAYRTATGLAPQDPTIRTNLAVALLGASAHEQAADELDVVIACEPRASVAHLLRALSLLEIGREAEALAGLDRATRADPVVREMLAHADGTLRHGDRAAQGRILAEALGRLQQWRADAGEQTGLAIALGSDLAAAVEERQWDGIRGDILAPRRTSNHRLAFAMHSAELLNHYRHIWRRLQPGTFDLVPAAQSPVENTRIAAFGQALGHDVRFVGDLLADGEAYDVVVSNHLGSAGIDGSGAPILGAIGRRHVRMLYALGKSRWNFGDWNEMYEAILCWGPYQAGGLGRLSRPRVVQVGYPRLDPLFWPVEDATAVVAELGGDPERKTIVWLPTWAELSSIDAWAPTIGGLQSDFNVIVKVHPLTQSTDPERMRRLADAGLVPVSDPLLDNARLLRAADVVLADYGGSPFAAIYADRDVVLLNVEAAADNPLLGRDSIDVSIRQWMFAVSPAEPELLPAYFANPSLQQDQRELRERLRRAIFAPYEGVASDVAALAISAAMGRSERTVSVPASGSPPRESAA